MGGAAALLALLLAAADSGLGQVAEWPALRCYECFSEINGACDPPAAGRGAEIVAVGSRPDDGPGPYVCTQLTLRRRGHWDDDGTPEGTVGRGGSSLEAFRRAERQLRREKFPSAASAAWSACSTDLCNGALEAAGLGIAGGRLHWESGEPAATNGQL